jgi:hypothetical protein
METVNLKAALTFRIMLHGKPVAFTTKTFRGERGGRGTIPDPQERVLYTVHEITLNSDTTPWLPLESRPRIEIIWSNVLSVQHEWEAT